MQNVKHAISNDLSHCYNDQHLKHLLNMCAFLHPRFKDLDLLIPEEEQCEVVEAVKLEMYSFLRNSSSEEDTPSPVSPPKKRKLAESLFANFSKSKTKNKQCRGC